MPDEFDLHAAGSLWASRAARVSEFESGDWTGTLYRAHPDDADSVLGRLACAVSSRGRFRGLVFVRSQRPQLHGAIFTAIGTIAVESAEFLGDVGELEARIRLELERAPEP